MDVADTGRQHGNAEVGNLFALFGVRTFAHADDAVFFAADGADFRFQGNAFFGTDFGKLSGLGKVLFNGKRRAVEHDGGEPGFQALVRALIGAVVQMQGDRNGNAHGVHDVVDHVGNVLEAAHIFAGSFGDLDNDGSLALLRGLKDRFGPLKVVEVECTDGIVTGIGGVHHFFCGN